MQRTVIRYQRVIRNHQMKDRQHNGQKKNDTKGNTVLHNTKQKHIDWATRIPPKTNGG